MLGNRLVVQNIFEREEYDMKVLYDRGVVLMIVKGVFGWIFAFGMAYMLTVIAFSM